MANQSGGFRSLWSWFGWGGALAERRGDQFASPSQPLAEGLAPISSDTALQLSAVWACVDRRASIIASLPFFAFMEKDGEKSIARGTRLYDLLHDSPNSRMTPFDFWRSMIVNHDLRGNAYARIDRNSRGEAVALWPMPADQVTPVVQEDGSTVYIYRFETMTAAYSEANVLHLRNLGNGTVGLSKLEFMRPTTSELTAAQISASRTFASGGKPTGVLMIDKTLTAEQRDKLRANFGELAEGNRARLAILEASMKYQQLSISAEDQQLLETRRFGVEEICRWFDVPPVLIYHSNVTTWGSGVAEIIDGFHKFTIRPMLVAIEQAVRKRVMTVQQRATMDCEFNLDALLRGSTADRYEIYSKGTQNGVMTRNEARQLENLPKSKDKAADQLTVQSNLVPLDKLGETPPPPPVVAAPIPSNPDAENAPAKKPVAQ